MKALEGKVALVTGVGRKQGIGFALCKKLSSMGASIFYTYWHPYDAELELPGSNEDPQLFLATLLSEGIQAAWS
jgi:3-oxoacyl-[acyl-carrier protein] reductase